MKAPEAVVVAIGEEVLRGEVVDSNSAWLGAELSRLGFRVAAGMTVADREPEIVKALRRAARIAPVAVVTGGLGPTGDDLSAPAAAKFAGVELVESPAALENIAARTKCAPREVTDNRRRMALVPAGAKVYPNPEGSAPGIHIEVQRSRFNVQSPASATLNVERGTSNVFLLPGVPREMKAIFSGSIAPALEALFPERPRRHARLLHVSGWPESRADRAAREALAELLTAGGLELGTKLGRGWVSLRVAAEGAAGAELVERAAERLAERFADSLWGQGSERLEEAVARRLMQGGTSLALAESCTGGLVASRLVSVRGVSAVLAEAIVTYGNEAKQRLLGVDAALIERHGAVSAECAEAMASGLRARSGADITLAITGIAGPEGGSAAKPVGTVHFAVAGPRGVEHQVQRFGGGRDWVRERAASHGLWLIWRAARKHANGR